MITVMGATGHTGGAIAELLLKAGEQVRALGRSESKLAGLTSAGAAVLAGDAADAAFLTRAFSGADAVYTLLPPDLQAADYSASKAREGEAIVQAIRASRVRHVVFLSSLGADQPSGTGFIGVLRAQEERLRLLTETNVLVLRPGSFFENFYASLELVKTHGLLGDSVAPDVALPMIATRDIASAAAQALRTRDWHGLVVRELLGPRDLTWAEATRILGERIGKPDLAYVQFPDADMVQALVQGGLSADAARLYVEMTGAFNAGRVRSREGRTAANSTKTRFEDFAVELARAYA
jgi:uncharacterized protein YbjT (DUF2867 family)